MKIKSKEEWLVEQLKLMANGQRKYEKRAILMCMSECAIDQKKRLEQAKGELDGRLWSPKSW
ncbi:hypothetical protein [Liquorilactobacillus oeni]|uniref:hypothetical protein n=1 Tax=Liquorilactobacillus oeni TaxID=303241 RepID=UPI00070E3177|nr:hypothetical protein [Liquorilactobacillus oeni]